MDRSTLITVPINQLVQSKRNVRKSKPSKEADQELLAGIRAEGLLQNLVVVPNGKPGMYEVTAGKRRLKALQQLVKEGHYNETDTVPCRLYADGHNAEKISLIENIQRLRMHPADEFEACRKMQRNGMGVEDIAAALGMPESTVRQRLKLSQVAPEIIKAYRDDEITLEAVMAFTVEDDHTSQLEVYTSLQAEGALNAWRIKSALRGEAETNRGKLARFVGEKAYVKAGGTLSHDLFAEVTYFNDRDILVDLAIAKLDRAAKKYTDEWNWIEISIDAVNPHAMKRLEAMPGPETHALQEKLQETEERIHQLQKLDDELDYGEWEAVHGAQYQRLQDHADQLEQQIQSTLIYSSDEKALAGCIVTINGQGQLHVIEGLVRKSDESALRKLNIDSAPASSTADRSGEDAGEAPNPPETDDAELSEALRQDLTTYRLNIAKRFLAVGGEFEARDLLYYTLCMQTFTSDYWASPLDLRINETRPSGTLTKPDTGRAVAELEKARSELDLAWLDIEDPTERYTAFTEIPLSQKTTLMAFCVAQILRGSLSTTPAYPEAEAALLSLDIPWHRYFQPTSENYLSRISKEQLLALGDQFFSDDQAESAEKRTKKQLALELETIFEGKDKTIPPDKRSEAIDWIPAGFRPL